MKIENDARVRHRTKPGIAKSLRRQCFIYQGRIINRDETRNIIKELLHRGMNHVRIKASLDIGKGQEIVYQRLLDEIIAEQQNSTIDKPMFAIISEHPFKRNLADDQIMNRLQGPWLHASHLDDTMMDGILKRWLKWAMIMDGYELLRLFLLIKKLLLTIMEYCCRMQSVIV